MARVNITYPTTLVLQALSTGSTYGFEIMDATGLPSGTVYPLLRRLERLACVEARWEDEEQASREGRPARRHYQLTGEGREVLARGRARFAAVDHAVPAGPRPPLMGAG
ncbi:MAG TPA: PadR family transcriptional regulator [Longimicrobium sp.]|nr:PadR family transcriptional regulator [Longimicrobium sp.]